MTSAISAGPWCGVQETASQLGLSVATLYRRRQEGLLRAGLHYLRLGTARTSRTLWCPTAIREAMAGWSDQP
jgi:hypothetical protein